MSFKKLNKQLKTAMEACGFEAPNEYQKLALPKIKSGADLILLAPKGSGKRTTLAISIIQKLKCYAVCVAPIAIIFVNDTKAATELEAIFKPLIKVTYLRVYSINKEHHLSYQMDYLFEGTDIVIAEPSRLHEIYFKSGINFNYLQMMVIEDAPSLKRNSICVDIDRLTESLSGCQFIMTAEKMDRKMTDSQDLFMSKAQIIEFD